MIAIPLPLRPKDVERFWSKVRRTDGCWPWTKGFNEGGYGRFVVTIGGRRYEVRAHQLSWSLHNGLVIPSSDVEICHSCDNPPCVRPDHLFVGTRVDNQFDSFNKGRRDRRGSANGRAKLTPSEVGLIRQLRGHEPVYITAGRFGVTPPLVSQIQLGHIWKER